MKSLLVTGGTVFVSRYIAEYFAAKDYEVYVLNRNRQAQSSGVKLIEADRHNLGDTLRDYHFDVVIDTAYDANDVETLLDALNEYKEYILISSGAVYPRQSSQSVSENTPLVMDEYMDKYGSDKIKAEHALLHRNPHAYILRPSYLYGPMNNLYREAFVFDCALAGRKFYLPENENMKLQFFHIHDLCKFIDIILNKKPSQHIFNMGNKTAVSIREWVELCYRVAGAGRVEFVSVSDEVEQRNYFCFDNFEFYLDVSAQYEYMKETKSLYKGLEESLQWYGSNMEKVNKKPYLEYIDHHMMESRQDNVLMDNCKI